MLKDGTVINFVTVAEVSGVSKAWLYKEHKVADKIKSLREKQKQRSQIEKKRVRTSDPSYKAIVRTLKTRIKRLDDENKLLKHQLEVAYGELARQARN